jgi:hypothetical protein
MFILEDKPNKGIRPFHSFDTATEQQKQVDDPKSRVSTPGDDSARMQDRTQDRPQSSSDAMQAQLSALRAELIQSGVLPPPTRDDLPLPGSVRVVPSHAQVHPAAVTSPIATSRIGDGAGSSGADVMPFTVLSASSDSECGASPPPLSPSGVGARPSTGSIDAAAVQAALQPLQQSHLELQQNLRDLQDQMRAMAAAQSAPISLETFTADSVVSKPHANVHAVASVGSVANSPKHSASPSASSKPWLRARGRPGVVSAGSRVAD